MRTESKEEALDWACSNNVFSWSVSSLGFYFLNSVLEPDWVESPEDLSVFATQMILLSKDFVEEIEGADTRGYAVTKDLNFYFGNRSILDRRRMTAPPSLVRLVDIVYESEVYDLMDLSAVITQIGATVDELLERRSESQGTVIEQAMCVQAWTHVCNVIKNLKEEGFDYPPIEIPLAMAITDLESKYEDDEGTRGDDEND